MTRVFNYDLPLKCISGLVLTSIVAVVIAETDLLPPPARYPLRAAIHQTGDSVSRLPVVSDILRKFGY